MELFLTGSLASHEKKLYYHYYSLMYNNKIFTDNQLFTCVFLH